MWRLTFAALVGLLSFASVATAETASESHKRAASELLGLINFEQTMLSGATAMADSMIQHDAALAPYRDVLLKWAEKVMTWETFGPRVVALYTESFTEAELRDIISFYQTPTGQKARTVVPALMRRAMTLGAETAKAHSDELERMIRERAAELEREATKP